MRESLQATEGERITFKAKFERVGSKIGYNYVPTPTFLVIDVRDIDDNLIADHLWLNQTAGFKSLGYLKQGDLIQFDGRCIRYGKDPRYDENGVLRYRTYDYGISHPSKFKIIYRA